MGRYPLEALRGLRADEEDAAKRALADALRALEVAREATLAAVGARDAHEAETRARIDHERARPIEGVRPSDATSLHTWRARRKDEMRVLEDAIARARAGEAERHRAAELAREALANARREREAIEKHHERWRDDERKKRDAKEEAEAEDRRSR